MKKEIIKFLITGGVCTLLNYLVFYILLTLLGVNYLFSSAIGYISGVSLGYYMNKLWTFNVKYDSLLLKVKYLAVYLINMLIGLGLLKMLKEIIHIDPRFGNILSIGYTTVANFIGIKFLVFKKEKDEKVKE